MTYSVLPRLLDQGGSSFYRQNYRWQPKGLLPVYYAKRLWDDVSERWQLLEEAVPEIESLDRAPRYISIYKGLRLTMRRLKFAWMYDNLIFIQSLAEFYQGYGKILQMLKTDQARGRLAEEQ